MTVDLQLTPSDTVSAFSFLKVFIVAFGNTTMHQPRVLECWRELIMLHLEISPKLGRSGSTKTSE